MYGFLWIIKLNKLKRICFVASFPFTEPTIYNRLYPYIKIGQDSGYKVQVCLPRSLKKIRFLDKNSLIEVDSLIPKQRYFICRAISEIWNAWKILKEVPRDIDVVVLTIPSMFLFFGLFLFGDKVKVLDVRDLTWEYLEEKDLISTYFKKAIRFMFSKSLRFATLINCTNPLEKKYLDNLIGSGDSKTLIISNGVSFQNFQSLRSLDSPKKQNSSELVISYVGNIGLAQNLTIFLEAAKSFPKVIFNLVGDGLAYDNLYSSFHEYKNINFIGKKSWEELLEIYQSSDVLYAQVSRNYSLAIPSKLYEYLSTGRPIIYGGEGAAINLLRPFRGVYICEPDSIESLTSAINKIIINIKDSQYFSQHIKIIEKNYIREHLVSNFYLKLEKLKRNY